MVTQEDITLCISSEPAPGAGAPDLSAGPACYLETPDRYTQAYACPHSPIWKGAEEKELVGFVPVGTFEEAGGGLAMSVRLEN